MCHCFNKCLNGTRHLMFVMNLYLKVPEYCSCGEEKNKLWHNCVHIKPTGLHAGKGRTLIKSKIIIYSGIVVIITFF